jgi:hypothetical protein
MNVILQYRLQFQDMYGTAQSPVYSRFHKYTKVNVCFFVAWKPQYEVFNIS